MSGMISASKIKVNAAGDWQVVPPGGQITQIGNAGATSHGLVNNDDLFVSGKLEVDGMASFDGSVRLYNTSIMYGVMESRVAFTVYYPTGYINYVNANSSYLRELKKNEEVTIPVGQGAAGVNGAQNLAPENSIIVAVAVRVTQAPGGGATLFDVGRTGGNTDEFIQNLAAVLGTRSNSAADGDGVNAGPINNAINNTFVITTDANVTISDMKVRICVWYQLIQAPTT